MVWVDFLRWCLARVSGLVVIWLSAKSRDGFPGVWGGVWWIRCYLGRLISKFTLDLMHVGQDIKPDRRRCGSDGLCVSMTTWSHSKHYVKLIESC